MTSEASKQELLKQMEKIVEGVKQNREKVHVYFNFKSTHVLCDACCCCSWRSGGSRSKCDALSWMTSTYNALNSSDSTSRLLKTFRRFIKNTPPPFISKFPLTRPLPPSRSSFFFTCRVCDVPFFFLQECRKNEILLSKLGESWLGSSEREHHWRDCFLKHKAPNRTLH